MKETKFKRFFLIVTDSAGIGGDPRAKEFGDEGANTYAAAAHSVGGLDVPTMESLGLGHLDKIEGVKAEPNQKGLSMRLLERSNGKDTMTGHKIIGNKAASGTEIIKELGEEQMKENSLIVYTSADSVLQIAAHEEVTGLGELYRCCEVAREICLRDEYKVGRVIARPYVGTNAENFKRTPNRHDYALSPGEKTYLDLLKDQGLSTIGIGKIGDIFNMQGLTSSTHTVSNEDGMDKTIALIKDEDFEGLCFVNLVEFDSEYGHRRNPVGYARCLEAFDKRLKEAIANLKDGDLLMVTADHGNDPTFRGTDHTREAVPLLIYSPSLKEGKTLADRDSFADIGATIAVNFGIPAPNNLIGTPIDLNQ